MLFREQYYIDLIFKENNEKVLNLSRAGGEAGSNKGYKHSKEFRANRSGYLNPMYSREKSPAPVRAFLEMQKRDKSGSNNSMFGKRKTVETIKKLVKPVYVYDFNTSAERELLGEFSTINCSKEFKMGKDTMPSGLEIY